MASAIRPENEALARTAGVVLFVVSAVLLVSVGGAGVVAAPVTLPLMFLAVWRHPTRPFRIAGAIVGGLTAAELGWGLVYFTAGEAGALIWLVPLVAGAATVAAMATMGRG